jgi:pyruvate dehydrogenase E1 component alpha subunit
VTDGSRPVLPDALGMLERMWLIRAFEERVSELYARDRIAGLLHLGIGQEGIAVGLAWALEPRDRLFGGHRAHAHALARGADPARLLAEIAGRSTGYCGGKGGTMHIAAPESGFVTATGVVAGNIPLALGAAYASSITRDGALGVVAFGDGAGQTGSFHESLNIASLWGLPILFVCENNGYAEFSPLSAHTRVERLARHAETYGIPAVTVDGNDAGAVLAVAREGVARARSGGGPTFIEALTYRLRGHYEGDPGKYRELSELADWKQRDPLARFIADQGLGDASAELEAGARAVVDAATESALAAPPPSVDQLMTQVTAGVSA